MRGNAATEANNPCAGWMERLDRVANIIASLEDQCRWLREIGFQDVDCFWKYFKLAIFGGGK